jgi:hypothetical protein
MAAALAELAEAVTTVIEDPNTYKRLESARLALEELLGHDVEANKFLKFLELATQGEPETGEWEELGDTPVFGTKTQRLRVEKGWLYWREDCPNMILVKD